MAASTIGTLPLSIRGEPQPRPNMRFQSERRQYAGLLMLTGFCAVIQPLANIVSGVDAEDGPIATDPSEIAFWQFVGACCLFAIGVSSILVGFLEFVHDNQGSPVRYTLLILLTQTAFIPYISDMVAVGETASKDAPQFFMVFPDDRAGRINANALEQDEVSFMGAIGVAGIFSYGFSFVGTIAFMQFSLKAFQSGKPHHRNASYFQGRLSLYSFMLCLAGLSQILLGSFATELDTTESNGRIRGGALRVAMFVVRIPSLSIAVGVVQFLNGFWAFVRSFGVFVGDEHDNLFQYSMGLQWIITLTCQDIAQISLLPNGMLAPAAPTFAALSLGIHLMPAFLDYKMRTTPEEIPEDYFFEPENDQAKEERKPMMKRKRGFPPPSSGGNRRPVVYVVEREAYVNPYDEDFYDEEQNYGMLPSEEGQQQQPPLKREAGVGIREDPKRGDEEQAVIPTREKEENYKPVDSEGMQRQVNQDWPRQHDDFGNNDQTQERNDRQVGDREEWPTPTELDSTREHPNLDDEEEEEEELIQQQQQQQQQQPYPQSSAEDDFAGLEGLSEEEKQALMDEQRKIMEEIENNFTFDEGLYNGPNGVEKDREQQESKWV